MKLALFREVYGPDGEGGVHLPHVPTPAMDHESRSLLVDFLLGELLVARRVLLMVREYDASMAWGVDAVDHSRQLLVITLSRSIPPRKRETPTDYEARLLRIAGLIRHRSEDV